MYHFKISVHHGHDYNNGRDIYSRVLVRNSIAGLRISPKLWSVNGTFNISEK